MLAHKALHPGQGFLYVSQRGGIATAGIPFAMRTEAKRRTLQARKKHNREVRELDKGNLSS